MAKSSRKGPQGPNQTSSPTPASNESPGVAKRRQIRVEDVLLPTYAGFSESIETTRQNVVLVQSDLSLAALEQMMSNVQACQRNCTEALNAMSTYRRTVAQLLETRRRAAAQARKQANRPASGGITPPPLDSLPDAPIQELGKESPIADESAKGEP